MSMRFTLRLDGEIAAEADAADLGLDLDNTSEWFSDLGGDVEVNDISISGSVTLSARATVEYVEVEASDMADFDADAAMGEHVSPYGGVEVSNVNFEVTESPTGFDVVEREHGQDTALAVYVTLASSGYEVV